jgi:hypothetical protein
MRPSSSIGRRFGSWRNAGPPATGLMMTSSPSNRPWSSSTGSRRCPTAWLTVWKSLNIAGDVRLADDRRARLLETSNDERIAPRDAVLQL